MKYYTSRAIAKWRILNLRAIKYWSNPTEDVSVFINLRIAIDRLAQKGVWVSQTELGDEDEG